MTREEAREFAKVVQAYADGKTVQYKQSDCGKWGNLGDNISFTCPVERYRIKPEPKMVPLGPEDIPPVCWVRTISDQKYHQLVTSVGITSIWIASGYGLEYSRMFLEAEYSTDRKTWHKCEKEVTE